MRTPSSSHTALGLASRGAPPQARQLDTQPPIVLITLDTQRVDHLGTYGYFRSTSPVLDQFASQSVVFEGALATAGITVPSHLSMLTGLYPHQHGILGNLQATNQPFVSGPGRRTVPELLRDEGYRTAAFVSATPVKSRTGLAHGFQTYDEPSNPSRSCDQTVARASRWIRRQVGQPAPGRPRRGRRTAGERGSGPFFLWVHIWEPHAPNRPGEPWAGAFAADEQVYDLLEERRVDPGQITANTRKQTLHRFFGEPPSQGRHLGEPPPVDMDAMADLVDRYDAEVLHADACLGELLEVLEEVGVAEHSIVAVVGDHGQGLGQHGNLGHMKTTLDNIHVPMIVRFPEGVVEQPARIPGVVSTVDLMPTLLARFDGEATRELLAQAAGEDLLSGSYRRLDAFAIDSGTGNRIDPEGTYSWVDERWRFVYRPGGRSALYDHQADHGELEDVALAHPDVVEQATRRALAILADRPADILEQEAPLEDSPLAEELRALGYVH